MALAASPRPPAASKATQLVLEVQPATVVIFLDNKRVGTAAKPWTLTVKPGDHRIKLVTRIATHEETVSVARGEKKSFRFDLRDSGDKVKDAQDGTPSVDDSPAPDVESKDKDPL